MMPCVLTNPIDLLVVDREFDPYRELSCELDASDLLWLYARDGQHAFQIASGRNVFLWIANMHLPDMSGIELMSIVRAKRPTTPVYLVSDHYSPDEEREARAAGAAGYLAKPAGNIWFEICRVSLARIRGRASPPPKAISVDLFNATDGISFPAFSHKES